MQLTQALSILVHRIREEEQRRHAVLSGGKLPTIMHSTRNMFKSYCYNILKKNIRVFLTYFSMQLKLTSCTCSTVLILGKLIFCIQKDNVVVFKKAWLPYCVFLAAFGLIFAVILGVIKVDMVLYVFRKNTFSLS